MRALVFARFCSCAHMVARISLRNFLTSTENEKSTNLETRNSRKAHRHKRAAKYAQPQNRGFVQASCTGHLPQRCPDLPEFRLVIKGCAVFHPGEFCAFLMTFWVTPRIPQYSSASTGDPKFCNRLRTSVRWLTWRMQSSVQYGTFQVLPIWDLDPGMCLLATSISKPTILL